MGAPSSPDRGPSSELPANTLVVLPKPLPAQSGALWSLFWTIGLAMGLLGREIVDWPEGV